MLFFLLPADGLASQAQTVRTQAAAQTEEELISLIAGGDKEALAELYARTGNAVFGFALSILRNRSDAEDIMQDAYLRIYAGAAAYRPQGKPVAWILTIVRNLCMMKLRDGKGTLPLPDAPWDPPDPRDGIGNSVDRVLLETAMRVLSDDERQIVMLHAAAGQKHREIAALLGIPLPTVLSKYHRALAKLKKQLKEDAPDE